jgi:hypothetical protein
MLKLYCLKLRKTGKELEAENILVMDIKGLSGWRKRRTFYRKLRVYETQAMKAEKEYADLETASNFAKNYDMLAFTQKLVLGILYALLSLVWFTQMITENILNFQFEIKIDYITQLLDLMLVNGMTVLTSFFIVLMTYYLLIATIKGNYSFGFKFSSPTFYPFRQNET